MKTLPLILAVLMIACSSPTDQPDPAKPVTIGRWISDASEGQIKWELRDGTMWLISPYGSPAPYSLVTEITESGTSLSINAWVESQPNLVYSFSLVRQGATLAGRLYSKKGYFPDVPLIFRQ